jgi:hypothetical protein
MCDLIGLGIRSDLEPIYEAYRGSTSRVLSIRNGEATSGIAEWFLEDVR